jgi:hypothetical protein
MRWLTYLVWWPLVWFGFSFATVLTLGLWFGIEAGRWPFGQWLFLAPKILAAARIAQWGSTRKAALPSSYSGWPYRIAVGALVLIIGNFAVAYFTLLGGRSASGLPSPLLILVGTGAFFASEINDWYGRAARLPSGQRWPILLVFFLGFVVFGILYFPLLSSVGHAAVFAVFVAYLVGLWFLARYAGNRVPKDV